MKKNNSVLRIAFAGGGTGGHIYPGLAVADEFRLLCNKNNIKPEIHWIGNSAGMDKTIVQKSVSSDGSPSADFFHGIPCGKLRRYFSFQNLLDVFKIIAGGICSFFLLLKIRPALLFSKGGFVSVPPCVAAKILKIPVLTHECDFTPGLATKINSRFAKKILISYPETANFLPAKFSSKTVVTGNPVRPAFYAAEPSKGLSFLGIQKADAPILLVVGGSLGAKQINDLVSESLEWLCERFIVVHQTGAAHEASLPENASDAVKNHYKPYKFIYEPMPDVIAASDIVLSRAGANSIWECAVLAKPMVLIPLCGSGTRGDQEDNAAFFEKAGAAKVLARENAVPEKLKDALSELTSESVRAAFSSASGALCKNLRPAANIAELLFTEWSVKSEKKAGSV